MAGTQWKIGYARDSSFEQGSRSTGDAMHALKSVTATAGQMEPFPTEWALCGDDPQYRKIGSRSESDGGPNTPAEVVPDRPDPVLRPIGWAAGVGSEL